MRYRTDDLRINEIQELITPVQLHREFPISERASGTVHDARQAIHGILHGEDKRVLIVVGPCSIHDPEAAREYATKLKQVRDDVLGELEIVMRVYFEKPRTSVGWKGLINDPDLDGSFHINRGLRLARSLLLDLSEMGMPAATEYLDLISPQYVADLISWGAIGARTTESQTHRELASGLSCPVGFKNGTQGDLQIAIDAIRSASEPHHFLSVTKGGHSAIFSTEGNSDCHIILRGGKRTNFDAKSVADACMRLERSGLPPRLMIDCSHANCGKQHPRQLTAGRNIASQIAAGESRIIGVMIESHLVAGRQNVVPSRPLVYGQSITDACLGWDDTKPLLYGLAAAVQNRRTQTTVLSA